MKIIVVTTASSKEGGWPQLEKSLIDNKWDYELIIHPFTFGHQLPIIAKWCEEYKGDCTHLLYTDAWDTCALGTPEEVINKYTFDKPMLISAEKACYPLPELAEKYPQSAYDWKYCNGGGWLVNIKFFVDLAKACGLNQDSHDQVWLHQVYLANQNLINIDIECKIFQSIAFEHDTDFSYIDVCGKKRLVNNKTKTIPVFMHGNGHTDMTKIYNLLNNEIKPNMIKMTDYTFKKPE